MAYYYKVTRTRKTSDGCVLEDTLNIYKHFSVVYNSTLGLKEEESLFICSINTRDAKEIVAAIQKKLEEIDS